MLLKCLDCGRVESIDYDPLNFEQFVSLYDVVNQPYVCSTCRNILESKRIQSITIIACAGEAGDWAAYCADASKPHHFIQMYGQKIPRDIANLFFPDLDIKRYRE